MPRPPPKKPSKKEIAALFDGWNRSLQTGDPKKVADRYAKDAVLLPTVSNEVRTNRVGIVDCLPPQDDTDELGRMANEAGMFLFGQKDVREAVRLLERAHGVAVRFLGGNTSEYAVLLGNLGSVHYAADDLDTATDLHARAVEILRNTVGRDDPRTFRARGNLLNDLITAGEGARAVPVTEEYLADCVRRYDEDHPATLNARNNRAGAYQHSGNLDEAIDLLRHNVADRESLLRAGRAAEAVAVYERALEAYGRSLGEDHPHARKVRDNLEVAHRAVRVRTAPPE